MNTLLDKDQTPVDDNKNYLAELVGEGRKFKDVESLAKGKYYADAAVAVKDKTIDEMRDIILQQREEINKLASLEELLDQMKQRELANSQNTLAKEVGTKPMIDPQEEESRFFDRMSKYETQKKEEANLASVRSKLKEHFGDKTSDVLKQKMEDYGLSETDINNLAKKSPAAFYNSLGITLNNTQKETFQAPPRSSVRNDNFKPSADDHTWAWYQRTYKKRDFITNPNLNTQMAQDAARLGDRFYDGDFYNSYHQQQT